MAFTDPAERLERIIASAEKSIARQVLFIVRWLKDSISLDDLVIMLETGGVNAFLERVQAASAKMASDIATVSYIAAGKDTAQFLTDNLSNLIDFDQTNTRAVQALQQNKFRLVQKFTQSQRNMLRETLSEATAQGLNPREQARMIRGNIGLTERQTRAVNNYRRLLESGSRDALARELRDRRFDSTVTRAITGKEPLSQSQIDRMVNRYAERYVKYRSEVIARTEALRGVHEGAQEMYQQAVDAGDLKADELTRTWNTAMDERVRGSHAAMNGQVVRVNEPFVSGDGNALMYPGDINAPANDTIQCRCVVSVRIG